MAEHNRIMSVFLHTVLEFGYRSNFKLTCPTAQMAIVCFPKRKIPVYEVFEPLHSPAVRDLPDNVLVYETTHNWKHCEKRSASAALVADRDEIIVHWRAFARGTDETGSCRKRLWFLSQLSA